MLTSFDLLMNVRHSSSIVTYFFLIYIFCMIIIKAFSGSYKCSHFTSIKKVTWPEV